MKIPDHLIYRRREILKTKIGHELASVCVRANFPLGHVAQAFDVTKATIYKWCKGGNIRADRVPRIQAFIAIVGKDLNKGILPCGNLIATESYLQDWMFSGDERISKALEVPLTDIRNCKRDKSFCPSKWEDLTPTKNIDIRFCDSCEKPVYFRKVESEIVEAIRENRRIVIPFCADVIINSG